MVWFKELSMRTVIKHPEPGLTPPKLLSYSLVDVPLPVQTKNVACPSSKHHVLLAVGSPKVHEFSRGIQDGEKQEAFCALDTGPRK